jgi:hypothetical protein
MAASNAEQVQLARKIIDPSTGRGPEPNAGQRRRATVDPSVQRDPRMSPGGIRNSKKLVQNHQLSTSWAGGLPQLCAVNRRQRRY